MELFPKIVNGVPNMFLYKIIDRLYIKLLIWNISKFGLQVIYWHFFKWVQPTFNYFDDLLLQCVNPSNTDFWFSKVISWFWGLIIKRRRVCNGAHFFLSICNFWILRRFFDILYKDWLTIGVELQPTLI